MVWLNRTYYSLLKLQAKFSKLSPPVKIPVNYANSAQFARTVREFCKIRTFCLLILHYVSGTCLNRKHSQIPANYANSAQFAHTVRELREIRTIC